MFEALSDRLSSSLKAISGKSKLTEDNIRDTLRDVRGRVEAVLGWGPFPREDRRAAKRATLAALGAGTPPE